MRAVGKLKQAAMRFARNRGIELRHVPTALLHNPQARLNLDLGFVLADMVRHKKLLTFVQVGAYDGEAGDSFREFRESFSRGILVEPQRKPFEVLQARFGDDPRLMLANVAIGERDETRDFYTVDTLGAGLPSWAEQLASFQKDVILKHRRFIPDIDSRIITNAIETVTLPTLLARAGLSQVDLLQIDAEGYDGRIVRSINYAAIKPSVIRYEHKHLGGAERDLTIRKLIAEGYMIALEFEDTIAYRRQ